MFENFYIQLCTLFFNIWDYICAQKKYRSLNVLRAYVPFHMFKYCIELKGMKTR